MSAVDRAGGQGRDAKEGCRTKLSDTLPMHTDFQFWKNVFIFPEMTQWNNQITLFSPVINAQ